MTNHYFKLITQSAAIAFILPTAAMAQVSALDVWESWESYVESFGQTITVGSQEVNGDTLILQDITASAEFPEGAFTSSLEFLEFRELSDGTVAITMAPDFPLSLSIQAEPGSFVDIAMIMRQSGASIIASGSPGDITFDYLASEISFALEELVVDGETIDATVQFAMGDIGGQMALTDNGDITYRSNFTAATTTYEVNFTDPTDGGNVIMNGSMDDVKTNTMLSLPEGFDLDDPSAMFGGDFNIQGGLEIGAMRGSTSFDNPMQNMSITTLASGGSLNFAILDGSISYGGITNDLEYTIESALLPLPGMSFSIAETAFSLLMPLAQSDEPQDFGFLMRMADLEISDTLWGMFDAAAILPRDPATILLDLSGSMNWLLDITDPKQTEAFTGEAPALLHRLTIEDIVIAAVGAEISGQGEFTFDNTDMVTFNGIPAPTGVIEMDIVGVNGLLDRLIQMGLLPAEQAAGARMMLGLFARPSGGEDTLSSTIEVNGDGSIFANGQQLR